MAFLHIVIIIDCVFFKNSMEWNCTKVTGEIFFDTNWWTSSKSFMSGCCVKAIFSNIFAELYRNGYDEK
jgi:hypothetical protein